MVFWILTGALALALVALLVVSLLRGTRETGPAESFDLQVYRDQLKEIDRDTARGVIAQDEAERLRVEISRRLLAADAKAQAATSAETQPRSTGLAIAALMAVCVLGGSFGLYTQLGAPNLPDLPLETRIANAAEARDNRPGQAEVEARLPVSVSPDAPVEYVELVTKLREAVVERPDDLQGHILLTRSEAALGNYAAAWKAQEKVIALRGDQAHAKDYTDLADMMILSANGYVSPEAQDALEMALSLDGQNGVARYYGGLMMAQTGRPDVAFRMWDSLLRDSPPDAPWVPPIRDQIEDMAYLAGQSRYQLPDLPTSPAPASPQAPGPSGDDVAAAAELTPEERMQMIQGMVSQLSERLAEEGGSAEEWARLINALGVLGETERAAAIWGEAQSVFAQNAESIALINAAAQRAGLK